MANYNQSPGFFGTGRYRVQTQDIDQSAQNIPDAGLFHSTLSQGAAQSRHRSGATTQAAQINTAQQGQAREAQMALLGRLTQAADGQGPSVAQAQLQGATDRNFQQAAALANTQRGMGGAAAARQVAAQAGLMGQQAANDSAVLRAQEQQAAMAQLGQFTQSMRGQDIDLAAQQANLQQQTNLANLQSEVTQRQMNDQATQFYLNSGMSLSMAQQQAAMDMQRLLTDQNLAYNQIGLQATQGAAAGRSGLIGAGLQTAGSIIGGLI